MSSDKDIFDPAGLGLQVSGVRQSNQRAIMTLIALNPGLSAAELSRRSQLAPQTVSAILDDLQQAGLLRAGEVLRGRRGQPATPYFIDGSGAYAMGVEIGWRQIEATLVNIGGEVLAQYRRDYSAPDPRTIFKELGGVVRQFQARLPEDQRHKLIGLGISAPGSIARNVNLLDPDPELQARWQGIDLAEAAEDATGLKVQLFNDGNAACWAELGTMAAPRPASYVYLLVSTFVAAGIIAENVLWEGPTGNSANLGSMLVNDRWGKRSFVHLLASIYALEKRLTAAGIAVPATTPLFWPWDEWEPHVTEWLQDAGDALAKTIVNTAAVFEFKHAVIDGVLPPNILDRLIKEVEAGVAAMPTLTSDTPQVLRGHLGSAAPATGAAYLPLFRRFFSRDLSHLRD